MSEDITSKPPANWSIGMVCLYKLNITPECLLMTDNNNNNNNNINTQVDSYY